MKGAAITFRCSKCRSTVNPERHTGRANRVVLTGRTKSHRRQGRFYSRLHDGAALEYRCLDCGHCGWSAHRELRDLLQKVQPAKTPSPIDQLIDAATGAGKLNRPRDPNAREKELADQLAKDVLADLRYYYPEVVKTRPSTWPEHLRNTIATHVGRLLARDAKPGELLANDHGVLSKDASERLARDDEAIARCYIRGLVGKTETARARKRLLKRTQDLVTLARHLNKQPRGEMLDNESILAPSASSPAYATGEQPAKGDIIRYAECGRETRAVNREAREHWIVTSVAGDMVRAKCRDAHQWRQAFYTSQMRLIERSPNHPTQIRSAHD